MADSQVVLLAIFSFSFVGIVQEYSLVACIEGSYLKAMHLSFIPDAFGEKGEINETMKNLRSFKNTTSAIPRAPVESLAKSEGTKDGPTITPEEPKIRSKSTNTSTDIIPARMVMGRENKVGSTALPALAESKVKRMAKGTQNDEKDGCEKNQSKDTAKYMEPVKDKIRSSVKPGETNFETTIMIEESKVRSKSTNKSKDSKGENAVMCGETKAEIDTSPSESKVRRMEKARRYEDKEIMGWEKSKSRDPTNYVEPLKDTAIISGREICENPSTTIVIICMSRPAGFSRRAAIRETWASLNVNNVRIGFIVGQVENPCTQISIQKESERFKDVIQENFLDSYMNLTLKSILMLKWYIRECPGSSFLMKVDDDTFVDLELLVRRLADHYPRNKLLGFLFKSAGVDRNRNHKWYVPKYLYPNKSYPPYLNGPAYVMSRDVATKLYATALTTPLFHLEDVYITGICAWKANVEPRHFKFYFCYAPRCSTSSADNDSKHLHLPFVTFHPLSQQQMRFKWKQRKTTPKVSTDQSKTPAQKPSQNKNM